MYITTNLSGDTSQAVPQVECPIICEQPLHIYVNLLGAVFGISCLAIYLAKKNFFLHARSKKKKLIAKILSISFWVFLALFVLYFLQLGYQATGNNCPAKSVLLSNNFFPDFLHPLYKHL